MRLTTRGLGAVAVVAFAVVMAAAFGARALNGLVVPLLVALAGAVVSVARTDGPTVGRRPVEAGFPGERRTVEVTVETDSPTAASVADAVGDGLSAPETRVETTLDEGTTYEYDLRLDSRGERRVGPLSVVVTDVLGLVEQRFEDGRTTPVLVYPRVYDLRGGAGYDLRLLTDEVREGDREEFDYLREYRRGDALRDVHWKSAAKRVDDELVVKEFVADETVGSTMIAVEPAPRGDEEELLAAAASVARYLLEREVAVGLLVAGDSLPPDTGDRHRHELLRTLALADLAPLDERDRRRADVVIHAGAGGAAVDVGGREIPFDRLRGDPVEAAALGADGSDASEVVA
ncbi:DUF58 domain-containing protein [Salinilacihabitans rarus]|uniref:DUF58 domain-containing protein n=1 Tax=Salinilacihabitans rarus TaxID=2961596 RepID=UPI0020C83EA4|nr:DUF58 domain-containing protein [Salinilacihabitans rarus]